MNDDEKWERFYEIGREIRALRNAGALTEERFVSAWQESAKLLKDFPGELEPLAKYGEIEWLRRLGVPV